MRHAHHSAWAKHDWEAYEALYVPDVVCDDHRLLGWGTLHGAAAFLRTQQATVDLAPDVCIRADHVRASDRSSLYQYLMFGTRDGGAFELPFLRVDELDGLGKVRRLDIYDLDQIDAAWTRFNEIGAIAASNPFARKAAMGRVQAAFDAAFATGEWDAMRALCAPGAVFEDRQRLSRVSGDRELMLASLRERVTTGARPTLSWIGHAGERIALGRMLWSGGPADGRFEIEYLSLTEMDEAGLAVAIILFDADDPRVAQREAWARWAAIDPASAGVTAPLGEAIDAFNDRDRARFRAAFADDLVVEDRRRTGMGRLEGRDAYVDSVAVLWELVPASRVDCGWFWPAYERHGAVTVHRRSGTLADGGTYESEFLWVLTVAHGRITRAEMFELEDLDGAVARLEELRPK